MQYQRPRTEQAVPRVASELGDVQRRLVSFERSAIVGVSLLLAASLALQTLISAHGHVVGQTAGQAKAAIGPPALAEAPDPRSTTTATGAQRADRVHRFSTLAARIGPDALAGAAQSGASQPAGTVAVGAAGATGASEHDAAVRTASGLRSDTFGPDPARKPKLRLASIGSLPGGLASVGAGDDRVSPSARPITVIRPGDGSRSKDGKGRVLGGGASVEKVHFQEHTPERCLPHDLLDVIYDIADRFGEVTILSTFRSPERNRRVGGAEHSFHLSCQAIDFRVSSASQSGLLAYLEARPEVGGLKRYPMGYFHIDNGPRRSW